MASEQHDTVFPEEEMDDDDEESHEEDEEEEEDDDVLGDDEENDEPSPSASSALAVTVAVPSSAISNGVATVAPISTATATTTIVVADSPEPKRQQVEEKKPLDDSRKLFQRLWTDEDEIELLQGFLDYTTQRGSSHHNDTALFYDQIKSRLQLDFNKNQLVEKIRRLKKKYRNVLNKMGSGKEFAFKSAHDQATFEISRKIWSDVAPIGGDNALDDDEINLNPNPIPNPNFSPLVPKSEASFGNSTRKRSRPRSAMIRTIEKRESIDGSASIKDRDRDCINSATVNVNTTAAATTTTTTTATNANNNNNNCGVAGLVEETVRSCLSPLMKELVAGAMGGPFGGRGFSSVNPVPSLPLMNLGFGGGIGDAAVDEKWRKQQILELEVYSKRLELVQDQIKAALEELRSFGGVGGGGGGGG